MNRYIDDAPARAEATTARRATRENGEKRPRGRPRKNETREDDPVRARDDAWTISTRAIAPK